MSTFAFAKCDSHSYLKLVMISVSEVGGDLGSGITSPELGSWPVPYRDEDATIWDMYQD